MISHLALRHYDFRHGNMLHDTTSNRCNKKIRHSALESEFCYVILSVTIDLNMLKVVLMSVIMLCV
jgi:hypothetical protein